MERGADPRELIRHLVERIETADSSLHRGGGYLNKCDRLRRGLLFTKPADGDCGLDDLLSDARAFLSNTGERRGNLTVGGSDG